MMTRGNMILAVLTMANLLLTGAALGQTDDVTQGTLMVTGESGKRLLQFPLEHTDVEADITGLIAKVNVTQTFGNPYGDPIEAVYVFPLPENAAVNDMVMQVGDRTIRADIQTREQARETYEEAVAAGQRAALLEQERPNIFTQSVGNIMPGDEIEITITYVQDLEYDHGTYEFVFPMVVGPRFIPGQPVQAPWEGGGWAPDTDQVPDASRITPPVLTPDTRSGHDIDVHVSLNAGVPIQGLRCTSHEITSEEIDDSRADIKLHPSDTIPNKDFILKYDVMGEAPEFAFLPYHGPEGGFFLMMIQPKADYTQREITPKEMIFVVDCSGSMSGAPIETCKMAMKRCVSGMNGSDTFNVIKFSDAANGFADKPLANTSENVDRAMEFIDGMQGTGGTQMIEGIKAALDFPHDPERLRIVFFMTDGYIGNETEILGAIDDKLGDARLFSLGVGSSVNRFLLEEMSRVGRGTVQYVRQDEEPGEVVERFYERIDKPFLTHIEVATEGVDLVDVYPDPIPDLFSAQPVTLVGRYQDAGRGTVRVEGRIAGEPWSTEIPVALPGGQEGNDALASLWARKRIADLTASMYHGEDETTVEKITNLALEFRLMSPYTSFVAVEDKVVNEGGETKTVQVPVEMPEGVSYEGVFGDGDQGAGLGQPGRAVSYSRAMPASPAPRSAGGAMGPTGPMAAMEEAEMDDGFAPYVYAPSSWIAMLDTVQAEEHYAAFQAIHNVAAAARQVAELPNQAPEMVPPEAVEQLDLEEQEWPVRLLILPAAEISEELAEALTKVTGEGTFIVLLGSPDEASEALAGTGFSMEALPADHPVITGEGTLFPSNAELGAGSISRDGVVQGFVVPLPPESAAEVLDEESDTWASLMANIMSYALQGGELEPVTAATDAPTLAGAPTFGPWAAAAVGAAVLAGLAGAVKLIQSR